MYRLRYNLHRLCLIALLLGQTHPLYAILLPPESQFPQPPTVRKQIWFWQQVFYKYPSTTVVIHDKRFPLCIIDIVDIKKAVRRNASPREEEKFVNQYVRRYQLALQRFAAEGRQALRHGAMEQRILQSYQRDSAAVQALLTGTAQLRLQRGLADTFLTAANRAMDYLPFMEKEFARLGLPKVLTRIAFVESMFNPNAQSHIGASGIWQFMPATAREYLHVNPLIDERRSPFKSSIAAAQLLKSNYAELGAWPLAVTAYNHGPNAIKRAAQQLRTTNFEEILSRYRGENFGFASRNFYAEFLAASHTFKRLIDEKRVRLRPSVLNPAVLEMTPHRIQRMLREGVVSRQTFQNYNRDLNPQILERWHLYRKSPNTIRFYVPTMVLKRVSNFVSKAAGPRLATSR